MEAFIQGVRSQPCLWNPLHADYREMQVRDNAWQRVVKLYNNDSIPNIKVARIEWKKLRDNHREALKRAKLGQNKLLPAHITTWKYAKAMQFLEPHMKYRITENIELEQPEPTHIKNVEQDVSTTEDPELNIRDSSSSKKRCYDRDKSDLHANPDALESFFNCMLKSTREMPQWMQTQVKKKIFAIIIEAEESLSGDQMANLQKDQSSYCLVEKIKPEVFSEDSCDDNI